MSAISSADRSSSAASAAADGAAKSTARPPRSRRRELALALVTLTLILGASADFLRAQTLKLEPSPLDRPRVEAVFSPRCECDTKATATLAFTVRRPLRADAQMIDGGGRAVRSLARRESWEAGRRTLQWDGRDNRGRLVGDGAYRLRVRLLDEDRREILFPTPVAVDTVPPRATLLSIEPSVLALAPNGREEPAPIEIRYAGSEPARALVLVDGRSASWRRLRPSGRSTIEWGGRARGALVGRGRHEVSVRLRDRAGNLGPPTRSVEIRVRRGRAARAAGR